MLFSALVEGKNSCHREEHRIVTIIRSLCTRMILLNGVYSVAGRTFMEDTGQLITVALWRQRRAGVT